MPTKSDAWATRWMPRFGIVDLLYFTTLSAILAAVARVLTPGAVFCLWVLLVALVGRLGWVAISAFAMAIIFAGGEDGTSDATHGFLRQFAVSGITIALCLACRVSVLTDWFRPVEA